MVSPLDVARLGLGSTGAWPGTEGETGGRETPPPPFLHAGRIGQIAFSPSFGHKSSADQNAERQPAVPSDHNAVHQPAVCSNQASVSTFC